MPSLVEREREIVAAESDDFFNDDTILFYLNKVKQRIVSFFVQAEQENNKSLRVLDSLRQHNDLSVNGLTFTDEGDYYSAEVIFPTSPDEINQFTFVKYDQSTIMRELSQNNRIKLEWGNLSPKADEAYYLITKDSSDNVVFEIYTSSDDSATSKNLRVYYILNPSTIALADQSLDDLPERVENALLYGAAKLMLSQEGISDPNTQKAVQLFGQTYQEELQINTY